ncbi:YbaK/EbsC family protein [Streptomyces marispadix]|uniref:YbaK/EbsC family protein n=1 Tax=Streptomyces marispadix TaxID=2922868 RepID=A0ABS9SSD0_9ACTN|nr:YbaK/EbsC family protein [Streptomyces marispadix]MCH6158961.1 YbaK/EbsC family protein [Streptomyces marispadix]
MRAPIGNFDSAEPAAGVGHFDGPAAEAIRAWTGTPPADQLLYVDTDPEKADTAVFVEHYGEDLVGTSANCVVVAAKRGGERTLAACVVLSTTRVDVNGTVRRRLDARKASFAPMGTAVEETGMEYGGITPIGLPAGWPLLIDASVAALEWTLIGSGRRRGKLIVPGKALAALPGAVVLEGLGV